MSLNVGLGDLMTLLGVQQQLKAQKAIMITNTGYSPSCLPVARENGIALLIVRPAENANLSPLPTADPSVIAAAIERISFKRINPIHQLTIIHKAFDLAALSKAKAPALSKVEGPALSESAAPPSNQNSELGDQHSPAEEDFTYLIESAAPTEEDSIDNKMLPDSAITNRMIDNSQDPEPPSPPPFGIRTK